MLLDGILPLWVRLPALSKWTIVIFDFTSNIERLRGDWFWWRTDLVGHWCVSPCLEFIIPNHLIVDLQNKLLVLLITLNYYDLFIMTHYLSKEVFYLHSRNCDGASTVGHRSNRSLAPSWHPLQDRRNRRSVSPRTNRICCSLCSYDWAHRPC